MSRSAFLLCLVLILGAGTLLRVLWLRADPPVTSVGVVWHDEGAWVHNARNRALFDTWRTDNWNPVFVAPVFTALEYAAFETFGVGTWQARTVPVASGLAAVALLMAGLWAIGGRAVAAFGGALLATNYISVMWSRAALIEPTMTTFIVASWAGYALAARQPAWGVLAGMAAALAWFTKAAAAFFVAAIVLDACITLALTYLTGLRARLGIDAPAPALARGAWLTLAGLAATGLAIVVWFVLPWWSEYSFYNWQMSVTRKPSYALADLTMRASWIPIVQDFFSRMWLVVLGAMLGIAGIAASWRSAAPGERLLALWVLVGFAELTVHDSGNERRYLMFVPALVALASLVVWRSAPLVPRALERAGLAGRLAAVPLVLLLGYIVYGSLVRIPLLDDIRAGNFSMTVRLAAGLSTLTAAVLLARWTAVTAWLSRVQVPRWAATGLLAVALVWNVGQYSWWATRRTYFNYDASRELGELLPPGTLVQGKLANGLALENRIHPVFIGNGFGNYDDRLARDDVRYILTYTQPTVGYESGQDGRLIVELLDHYPGHHLVASFTVEETPGPDVAALYDKHPGASRARD